MTLLIGIALSVLGAAALGLFMWRRVIIKRAAASNPGESEEWPLPPLYVPPELARAAASAARQRAADAAAGRIEPVKWAPPTTDEAPTDGAVASATQAAIPAPSSAQPRPLTPPAQVALPPAAPPSAVPSVSAYAAPEPAEVTQQIRAGQVRFHRLPEGTLQLLPGRLEILRGNERIEEIRFVRVPGREAVVTFGRSEGEPHKHVQLEARTVSRQHASMRFSEGHWQITNLSRTNPVVVNGEPLAAGDAAARVLADGDQLEMGEVVFRFRAR